MNKAIVASVAGIADLIDAQIRAILFWRSKPVLSQASVGNPAVKGKVRREPNHENSGRF